MTTPNKQGITYFPFHVDFLMDNKVRRVMKKCGTDALPVIIHVLGHIYKNDGYFTFLDEDLSFGIAETLHRDEEDVEKVIFQCIKSGFFDSEKYENYGILTSKDIQKNYFFAAKRRKDISVDESYLIDIEPEKIGNKKETKKKTQACIQDVNISGQIKEKKKRVNNKIKNKKRKDDVGVGDIAHAHTGQDAKNENPSVEGMEEIPSDLFLLPPPTSSSSTPTPTNWRFNFKVYIREMAEAFRSLIGNPDYIRQKEKFYPDIDVVASLQKIILEYWATPKGWEHKKKSADNKIDWRLTFDQQMNFSYNQILKTNKNANKKSATASSF